MKRIVYLAVALLAAAVIAWIGAGFGVGGYDVSAAIYPRSIFFGETAVYKITALCGSGVTVAIRDNVKDLMSPAAVLKEGISERSFLWRKRREFLWSFSIDRIGDYSIPPVRVVFIGPSGDKREVKTSVAVVAVKSMTGLDPFKVRKVSVDDEGPYRGAGRAESLPGGSVDAPIRIRIEDRRPPLSVFNRNKALITAGVAAAAVTVIFTAVLIWSRRPRIARYISPEEAFKNGIDAINLKLSGGQYDMRELYYALSLSVRAYLKSRLGLSGQEPTTKDLLEMIAGSSAIEHSIKSLCSELLTACDREKYAEDCGNNRDDIVRHIGIAEKMLGSDPKVNAAGTGKR